jgi:protein-tyrosine phosphatase
MIDIHSHVLPGLDDGPSTVEDSISLARAAADAGTTIMVATPHVRHDYPFEIAEIASRTQRLNRELESHDVPLRVVAGGEVSVALAGELDDADLRTVCLADGPYILVESPYTSTGGILEATLFGLQARGLRPVLAHPERSPCFQEDMARLVGLVRKGILCSITSASITGGFGREVRRFTLTLVRGNLVHNVASDTHSVRRRPPDIGSGLRELSSALPRVATQVAWLSEDVPAAMLEGRGIPTRPAHGSRWRFRLPLSQAVAVDS